MGSNPIPTIIVVLGVYRIMVIITVCDAVDIGSIPIMRPFCISYVFWGV